MNAPTIWIIAPVFAAVLLFATRNQRILSILGGIVAVLLAVTAQFIPIGEVLQVGAYSFKIDSAINVLGRVLQIRPAEGSLLAVIYGATALWFFGAEASNTAPRLVPFGLLSTAFMVASIAVEPFLYAALFIELAILLSIPMLISIDQVPGRGIVRFLTYQTLALPFILLSGWLLAGVESSPGDVSLVTQSAVMLGLGFVFLLAIFPFYSWIPMLMEEVSPFVVGFVLWILPTLTIIFAASFLDRYSWLRSFSQTTGVLQFTGLLMVVTGGIWASSQQNLGRVMAYTSVAETGFAILALSLNSRLGVPILFLLLPARALSLAVWSLALTILQNNARSMQYETVRGLLRSFPFSSVALVLASLSMSAFPLLAGFPARLALWEGLSQVSLGAAFWMGVGIVGLLVGSFRSLAVLSMADEYMGWEVRENWLQGIMLGLGMIGLFVLGLFPQFFQYLLSDLPDMFERLGH